MISVGTFLRTNYSEFLGNLSGQIEIKSGDQGRLIESAKLLAKGLKSKDECVCDEIESIFVSPVNIPFEQN